MLVSRNVYVISPCGKVYKEDEMDFSLHLRYLSAKERRSGKYGKGPKPFTEDDRQQITTSLSRILSNYEGIQDLK